MGIVQDLQSVALSRPSSAGSVTHFMNRFKDLCHAANMANARGRRYEKLR
jgi:hypothetical protein